CSLPSYRQQQSRDRTTAIKRSDQEWFSLVSSHDSHRNSIMIGSIRRRDRAMRTMTSSSSGHHFVLASASGGIAVVLFLSLVSLLSIMSDVNNMKVETMEEMNDFRHMAESIWKSLTADSMFILGVRSKRGGGGGYAS
ncbi:hypothetical protein PENTCL1PPCAC_1487, partial [Pristionchus entomophagus]